ncbi:MAG: PAS domain S-box protein [Desulfobacteraceae bacterium]
MEKDPIDERPDIEALESRIKAYEKRLLGQEGMQRSLQQSQDRYRTVVEHTGTATLVISETQTVTMVNSSFERLTGLSKSAVEHRYKLMDIVPASERENLMRYYTDRRRSRNDPEDLALTILDSRGVLKEVLLKLDLVASTGE